MRTCVTLLLMLSLPVLAQPSRRPPPGRSSFHADAAESAVKQAVDQLASLKKAYERDIEVLRRLRGADAALVDAMQPAVAVQKAFEEVEAAKALSPEFTVMQGILRTQREIEDARRSPGTADFGRLRNILRDQALVPASRLAVRNALRLEEEVTAWLKIQQMIGDHLRMLSEISSASLRASEQER